MDHTRRSELNIYLGLAGLAVMAVVPVALGSADVAVAGSLAGPAVVMVAEIVRVRRTRRAYSPVKEGQAS
ncbi:hypothetical protein GCM10009799_26450 [Nocardiopsis rhodophaea]|uniref:Uncharacterized protein n=1 Tax=Nocardiopsis rhodophaea TaxID=280238 RepID=A0ABN2T3T3_9ACTN